MRNSIRRSGGRLAFSALSVDWISTRALDRVHHARELGEHAVAGGTDESAVVQFDQSVDDFAVRRESAESRLFVVPHEAAVAVHIGTEYGGELTFQPL